MLLKFSITNETTDKRSDIKFIFLLRVLLYPAEDHREQN